MQTALLLIDLQNDYFPGGACELHEAEKAVSQAACILRFFRKHNRPVFHVQHINQSKDAAFFVPDTPGVQLHDSVAVQSGETLLTKHAPDSFFQTSLSAQLDAQSIRRLVVCGMMTHMCVDTSVRAAKNFGYSVTLLEDACATKDLFHRNERVPAPMVQAAFMAALDGKFAEIATAAEWKAHARANHF